MNFSTMENENPYEGLYRVTVSAANIRKEPGIGKRNEVIGTVMRGTKFELTGEYDTSGKDKWFKIDYKGETGYILESLIEKLD